METKWDASTELSKPCTQPDLKPIRSLGKLRLTLGPKLLLWLLSNARHIADILVLLVDCMRLLNTLGLLFSFCLLPFIFFNFLKHLLNIGLAFSSGLNSDPLEHPDVSFTQIKHVRHSHPSLLPFSRRLFLIYNSFLCLHYLNQPAMFVRILFRSILVSAERNAFIFHDFAFLHRGCSELRHSCVFLRSLLSFSYFS